MEIFSHTWEIINSKIETWLEVAIAMMPNVVVAILVLIVFYLIANGIRSVVRNVVRRATHNIEVQRLISEVGYVVVIFIGLFFALSVLGWDKTVTSLLAGAGVVGLALGFAFQDIAANFIAGVILTIRRPFKDGDFIETNGVMGIVRTIDLRTTVIDNFFGQTVTIPNKDIFQSVLTNYSISGKRLVELNVGVSYDTDLNKAQKVAIGAVRPFHEDKDKEIELYYTEFADSSINFTLRYWIDLRTDLDYFTARSEGIKAVKTAFEKEGINIPYPTRTVYMSESD